MDENTIKQEVTQELRKVFAEDKPYTDSERLAAYEILLTEIQQMLRPLCTPYTPVAQKIVDMIDEEMDK